VSWDLRLTKKVSTVLRVAVLTERSGQQIYLSLTFGYLIAEVA
jgi:hypothetical protein